MYDKLSIDSHFTYPITQALHRIRSVRKRRHIDILQIITIAVTMYNQEKQHIIYIQKNKTSRKHSFHRLPTAREIINEEMDESDYKLDRQDSCKTAE